MFVRLTMATAMILAIGSTTNAQSNQYLVPNQTNQTRSLDQEVPILRANARPQQIFPAVDSAATRNLTAPTVVSNSTTPQDVQPDAAATVGENYFSEGGCNCGCGCNSGCGCQTGGGCGCGCGFGSGCGSGCGSCGAYDGCATRCLEEYTRIFGGTNELDEFSLGGTAAPREANFRDGWAFGVASGEYINCNLRREFEFAYRHNSADNITTNGQVSGGLTGNIQAYTGMTNLVYDLNNYGFAGLKPYVGGGIGIAYVDADLASGGATFAISDAAFAYQGFAGLEKEIGCGTRAFVEYRFLGTTDLDLESGGASTDVNYDATSILAGFQFRN